MKKSKLQFTLFRYITLVAFFLWSMPSVKASVSETANSNGNNEAAQESITITGKVTTIQGEALPGVNITIKGTSIGVITDIDGNFTINAPGKESIIVFSFIGYLSEEIQIGDQSEISVSMVEDITQMDEIIVVGYGTKKKVNLTGAVSSIDSDEINNKTITSLSAGLQGIAPGLTITQGSGQPGGDQGTIRIRGIGTLNNNAPLVLVDGSEFNIDDVDPNDIESISVLKDAAAASIYGVRAANGVILITTKRGGEGKTKLSYSGYAGIQRATKVPHFAGAQQYMKLVNLINENSGGSPKFTESDIAAYDNPNRNTDEYPDVNWMDEILQGSGFMQEHSLAISSGIEKMKYRLSVNSFEQKGLVKKTDFKRTTVRLNTDLQAYEKLHVSADMSFKTSNKTEPQDGMWFQFGQAYVSNPTLPVKYSDGTWGTGRGDGNPVRLQEEGGKYTYERAILSGIFKADYDITKDLKLTGIANINYGGNYNYIIDKKLTYINFSSKDEITDGVNKTTNESSKNLNTNFQALLNYNKTIGSHVFEGLAGVQALEFTTNYLYGYIENGSLDQLDEINAGDASTDKAKGYSYGNSLLSYFGRVNYSFDGKYLIEGNVRRDGSSRFAKENRWGVFPSFSAGWKISDEAFFDFSKAHLNILKFRVSWGQLGNQEVGNYAYQSTIALGYNYPFNGVVTSGAKQLTAANNEITWEVSEMTNVGADFALLNNRLYGTIDYYVKNTSDILLNLDIPGTVGLGAPQQNVGSVQNKGWEFTLSYKGGIGNEFKYNIIGNISDVKNKITELKGQTIINTGTEDARIYEEGSPIGAFYGYVAEGIFQTQDEVDNHATQAVGTTSAGDLKYKNQDDDNEITAEDRIIIGSNIPRYTYSLNLNASFKGIDLTAFFQGVGKVDVNTLQANKAPINQDGNFKDLHSDSWTPDNTGAEFPRLTSSSVNYAMSSYWIKSGAYLRLKNLQLGYTIPEQITNRVGISRFRFYANATNLFTWSKLNDYNIDPEMPNDARYYPQVKTVTFGINVDF